MGRKTGQLDFEGGDDNNRYVVMVRATDANAASAEVEVTIIVTNVDEKPTTPALTATTTIGDVFVAPENQTVIDADGVFVATDYTAGGTPPFTATTAATYYATDEDAGDSVSWSVEGADAGKFEITEGTATVDGADRLYRYARLQVEP